MQDAKNVILSGLSAGTASAVVLCFLCWRRDKVPWQVANATSHWVNGARAARTALLDLRHTGTGILTHYLASCFWAVPFMILLERRRSRTTLGAALATVATAAGVDYLIVPKRLTPGWELVLPRSEVGVGFLGMALGLVASGWLVSKQQSQ